MSLSVFLLLACSGKPGLDTGADDTACDATSWYVDQDQDGYGAGQAVEACEAPDGAVANDEDCNDADDAIHPLADEVCNGLDDDCDGIADPEGLLGRVDCYRDADGDGHGDPEQWASDCACPDGYVESDGDCDDSDPGTHPGAEETWYDGVDQDCGDDDDFDADGDGYQYGADDCDDGNAAVHPGAEEVCGNGLDDDCDGLPGECGLDGEVSSDTATESVVDTSAHTTWHLGTATQDIDADGVLDLLLARHGAYGGDESLLEYHLISLTGRGAASLDEVSVASFALATEVEQWSTVGVQDCTGGADLDGDGYDDYLLGAMNSDTTALRAASSRVYLEFGPADGEVMLDDSGAAIAGSADELLGGRGLSVIDTDSKGDFVVAAGVVRLDVVVRQPLVRFLGPAHFDGSTAIESAPTLWATTGEEDAAAGPAAIADLDGDGVRDLVVVVQRLDDPDNVTSRAFLGPFDDDRDTTEADATFADDAEGGDWSFVSAVCTGSDGRAWVVINRQDEGDPDGMRTHHRIHPWTGPGTYGDDSVAAEVREPAAGAVVLSCGGDIDDDGAVEFVSTQVEDSAPVEGGQSLALLFEPPSEGVWEVTDLAFANLYVPDRDDPIGYHLSSVLGTDFDGDGTDDLVYTTIIDPAGDGIGDQMVLFRHSGEPTGF